MDAGLTNLATLKEVLLSDEMGSDTQWDDDLVRLGKGIANSIEGWLGRKLTRATGDTEIHESGTAILIAHRYPIETLTTLEYRATDSDSWTDITTEIDRTYHDAGIIYLSHSRPIGGQHRLTHDAGYWHDTTTDTDGSLPSGAEEMPTAISRAFLLQCHHEAEQTRLFETKAVTPDRETNTAIAKMNPLNIKLLPTVKIDLTPYRRQF